MKHHTLFSFILLILVVSACNKSPNTSISTSLNLTSFNENFVDVSIQLDQSNDGGYLLSATFTPPTGFHLYSKDIPLTGVDGLGRPTLLELTEDSLLHALGELIESAKAEEPDFEPRELFVYPLGAVTLSLPIELPSGNEWVDETVKVTYMACSESICKPPVVGKVVSIHIPGTDTLK
jgi:hypothetical protein